jgi:hypothetical protein
MRRLLIVPLLLLAACAEDAPSGTLAERQPNVCLSPSWIQNTQIVDDNTILFRMSDGKVWKNTLQDRCFGLWIEGGFAYEVRGGEICGNQQIIHVLRSHSICMLGPFTAYVPPPKDESTPDSRP